MIYNAPVLPHREVWMQNYRNNMDQGLPFCKITGMYYGFFSRFRGMLPVSPACNLKLSEIK
jgi:hypothetical protein